MTAADKYIQLANSYILTVQYECDFSFTINPNVAVPNDGCKIVKFIFLIVYLNYLYFFETATSSRTFLFTITLLSLQATNPYYIIDYGDGSPVAKAVLLSAKSPKLMISYTYALSGIYTASVTVFNFVSSITLTSKVK